MRIILSGILIGAGLLCWYWGSFRLVGRKSYFWKIHAMGVSDTIGSLLLLTGALVRSFAAWSHILLAMAALVFWGSALGFVLARLGGRRPEERP